MNKDDAILSLISDQMYSESYNKETEWRFMPIKHMNKYLHKMNKKFKMKTMKSVNNMLNQFYNDMRLSTQTYRINLILFVDIDNWGRFFHLPEHLPQATYVMCFQGGLNKWKPPEQ